MDITAYAKINWDLRILGKRPDGFHAIDTVMVSVGLADTLRIDPAGELRMTCSDPSLPCDDGNLVLKAAHALARAAGVSAGAQIHLEKRIPAGGGLGGGSSDAAAALKGLNELWGLGWPREKLAAIAAQVGSDVAFFLWGGWAHCTGRGEIVAPLPEQATLPAVPLLLLLPPLHVSTPAVYKALRAPECALNAPVRALTDVLSEIRLNLGQFEHGDGVTAWPDNALLAPAQMVEPRLREIGEVLERMAPQRWQMSGSGAVHFVIARTLDEAQALQTRLSREYSTALRTVVTQTRRAD